MKKVLFTFMLFVILITMSFGAAAEAAPRLVDNACLLDPSEEERVLKELDRISELHEVDVVVITANDLLGYYDVEDAAKNAYPYLGYSENGIMVYISMSTRDVRVQLFGSLYDYISDEECSDIREEITPYLSNGDYETAFLTFAKECDDIITDATHFPVAKKIFFSLVIGIVIALVVTGILKGQLNSVRHQPFANNYLKQGSLNITLSNELFLYRNITRRRRQTNNSSGSSGGGGGGRSGGSSGKF